MSRPSSNKPANPAATRNNRATAVSGLVSRVLPADYAEQTGRIHQFQAFFDTLDIDPVFREVQVLQVEQQQLTLALPSPVLANYLRLYQRELLQMLNEQFHRQFQLKIIALPEASNNAASRTRLKPAGRFSEQVCERIRGAASAIDDDELRQSLLSLARRIQR